MRECKYEYEKKYDSWLRSTKLTADETRELLAIKENAAEISARFSTDLTFGTGGLRGKMMLGTATMNTYTVARTTQGLADYINATRQEETRDCSSDNSLPSDSVVIAYDSRNNSKIFAHTAASVLAANRIHVYIFDDIRPTPELSFAVRHLGCTAGINITASHNTKEYNGYKAYWSDGAQLSPDQANRIACCVKKVDIWSGILLDDFEQAILNGHISIIGNDLDEHYIAAVMSQMINPNIIRTAAELNIVYTPLHGAGYRLVPETLRRVGITNLYTVREQIYPDGNFPTVKKPNPEYSEAFACGIELAERVGCDLIIATDPDADRVGVMVRGADGRFACITGNQMGALLLDYIISAYNGAGTMPTAPYAVKTIVTTELMAKICRTGGVELYDVLTGFKYIGEVIKKKEAQGVGSFIFGAEESYGYLKGTHARDKDAVVASALICEMAAHYRTLGMTLSDALAALYRKHGYSLERTDEIAFEGYSGADKMKALMHSLRRGSPTELAGFKIVTSSDYLAGTVTDSINKTQASTGLPASDVLRWRLENSDVIIIRPSGTEPKLKIYYLLCANDESSAIPKLEKYRAAMAMILKI